MNVLSILGPTGAGKSAIALKLAKELNAEIISCDSMMIYRGMDIGTAKPSVANRTDVKHHLIDILDIDQVYNAAMFADDATKCIRGINGTGSLPILCGGTGLYAKALLYGYGFFPRNDRIALAIKNRINEGGIGKLLSELATIDPETAHKVKNNPQRLVRALEIVRITGKPLRHSSLKRKHRVLDGPTWILLPNSHQLRRLIEKRTKVMIRNGWIDETKRLIDKGLLSTPTASKALGYSQIATFLQGQISSVNELTEKIITLTCQYAKRQRTWFKNQHPDATILKINEDMDETGIVESILSDLMEKSI